MISGAPPPATPLQHLSPTQLRLYELLLDRVATSEKWVAECYISGHAILASSDVPDAVSAAAHQFRELVENLWRIIPDFPKEENKSTTNIGETARTILAPAWRELACNDADPPELDMARVEALDAAGLAGLMSIIHDFILRVMAEQPVRSRLAKTVDLVDPSGIAVPTTLQEVRRREWLELRKFFVRTCHGHGTPRTTFEARVAEFDDLLLRLLVPEGAAAIADLDGLIAEVEGG